MPTVFHTKRCPSQQEDASGVGEEMMLLCADSNVPPDNSIPDQPFLNLTLPKIDPITQCALIFSLYVGCVFAGAAGCFIGACILGGLCIFTTYCAIPDNGSIGDEGSATPAFAPFL